MSPALVQILKWIFAILSGMLCGYVHWLHAVANYPFSRKWRLWLFITGFLAGTLAIWGLMPEYGFASLLVSMAIGGVSIGIVSLLWFPDYLQSVRPKEKTGGK